MSLTASALLTATGVFIGMLVLFEAGRRLGIATMARDPDGKPSGAGPAEAAVFGLLGLLLAFTFSGAASRFEARRHLVTEEANAIGTAYLRVDLLPADAQPGMRQLFRRYLDTRLETYTRPGDRDFIRAKLAEAGEQQQAIWNLAIAAGQREPAGHTARVLLPALNAMIDITTTRVTATETHPPEIIFILLAGLSLVSALLVGYVASTATTRNVVPILILATTLSLTLYVILDLEFPRQGLIRVNSADHVLAELRQSMEQTP